MKFSIITATYNQLRYLQENLKYIQLQTFNDFEWIIADDGSTDGTWEWAKKNKIKIVGNTKHRFDYDWDIHNQAAYHAKGDYLVWIMGDSFPKENFLGELLKLVALDRVVNGMRQNVNDRGEFVSKDWRDKGLDPETTALKVDWRHMTLNSICIPKEIFKKIGGFYRGYKGYGRADIELVARAKNMGLEMWVAPQALIFHRIHGSTPENPENVKLFESRMKGLE